ncbi:MAG: hypothetical protein RRB22_03990 [Gammaproteobacteria bacterium]|nr:hypothetical protein [Gammaproteobacteria bacterium]
MNSVVMKGVLLAIFGAAALLTGCGGGGGGGGDTGFSAPSIPRVAIPLTGANAEVVTSEAYAAIEGTQNTTDFVPVGVVLQSAGETTEVNLRKIVSDKVREVIAQGPSRVNRDLPVAAEINTSEACGYYDSGLDAQVQSGSMSVTGTVNDPNALNDGGGTWTAGDNATISFNRCVMGLPGWVLNGTVGLTINANFDPSAVEDPSQCALGCDADIQVTITNLAFSVNQAVFTMHGAFNLAWHIIPTSWTETLRGDSLYLVLSSGGQTAATEISNFNIETIVDFTAATYAVSGTATVASTLANGSVTITAAYGGTVTISYDGLTGFIDEVEAQVPSTGTLTITGSNSSIVVTSLPGSVTIEVDEDGDDSFDGASIVTNWGDLE